MLKKIIHGVSHPKSVIIYILNSKMGKILSDETYLKILYRLRIGRKLNLENPVTFNEKMQWLKLHDRNPNYTNLADKLKVRDYISEIIGDDYLIPLLGVYDKFEDIDFDELPDQFVIKCNHDSGGVAICKDKSKFDVESARKKINKSLHNNYYYAGREWPYKNIEPKIIIEKYMEDSKINDLNDYKFFMFNGKLAYSLICKDRKTNLKCTFFDKDGKFLNITQDNYPNDKSTVKPKNYDEMIKLAEKLSADIIQVRVDFYEVDDKIYFGELTFFDSSGFGKFEPEEFDEQIGKLLKLPRK